MQIVFNGEERKVDDGIVLYELLVEADLNLSQKGIAVAVNEVIFPKNSWTSTPIKSGDRVNVIQAVQGG